MIRSCFTKNNKKKGTALARTENAKRKNNNRANRINETKFNAV